MTTTRQVDLGDLRVGAAVMLAAAAVLPSGHGIGLPCGLRALTGVPCPLCGLTGSVTATVHGDVADAFARNPAGPLVVVAAVVVLLLHRRRSVTVPTWSPYLVLAVLWSSALLTVR